MLRLLLTSEDLSGRFIIEENGSIDFIKRNLQINETVILNPYKDISEVPAIIINSQKELPMIAVLNVHSIYPSSSGLSLSDVFKRYLLSLEMFQSGNQIYKLLKEHIDLMVGFNRTGVRCYRFGHTPGLINQIGGPVPVSNII